MSDSRLPFFTAVLLSLAGCPPESADTGEPDLLFGAYSNGEAGEDAGKAYLVFGGL